MNTGRSLAAAVAACSLALLLPLAWPLLTGRVFVFNDLTWFHLPTRYLYQQALRGGDSLLWTPAIFSGFYLHGEGQIGIFHPLHLLWYGLLPLQAAFNLELIASYLVAFAGMYWFLHRLRFSRAASSFGAMLFAFSGFNLLHHHHLNMVAVVAHLPWLLGAADMVMTEDRPRARAAGFAGMAIVLASEFLLGFPQAVWWNAFTLAGFALYRAAETARWRRLLPCAAAVITGVVLGAIQLLPSADVAAHSVRATAARDFALSYSLHPFNLVQWWAPYFFERGVYGRLDYPWFHELGIYSGAILPIALFWVWLRWRALPERRSLMTAATIFALVTLVLALGRHAGVAALLTYLPVLGSLRAPVRYIVLTQFSLTILAAIAFDDFLSIAERRAEAARGPMLALWIPAGLSLATFVLNLHILRYGPHTFSSAAVAAPGPIFLVGVTVIVFLAGRGRQWAPAALVVLTMADLGMWGIRFIYGDRPRTIDAIVQALAPPPPGSDPPYASAPEYGPFRSDLAVLKGYRLTSGYVGLYPATEHPLDSIEWLRLAGTRWRISREGALVPIRGAAERARLVDEAGRPADGSARISSDRPGSIAVRVDAPGPRTLALTERFDAGWSATMGGVPIPTVRVEEDFLGCRVEAGVHRIELHFMPRSFVNGAIGSAAGVAMLAAGVLLTLRRREDRE
jgi:hypothetical protein